MKTGFTPENPMVLGGMIIACAVILYFTWGHVERNSDIAYFCYQQGFDRKNVIRGELFCKNVASGEIKSFGQLRNIRELARKR